MQTKAIAPIASSLLQQLRRLGNLKDGKRVVLIRHGETIANQAGIVQGATPGNLTAKGCKQARALMEAITANLNVFQSIYSSDLHRALQTAEIALGNDRNLVKSEPRLREIDFGTDENRSFAELSKDEIAIMNSFEYQAINGESWQSVRQRCIDFFNDLSPGNHLLFTHGGVIASLTWYVGLQDCVPNCSVVALELGPSNEPTSILFRCESSETD